jgi:DNA-binding transcriptional regulator YiaG
MRGLHKVGAVTDGQLAKTTLRMLGKDVLPKVEPLTSADIVAIREQTGMSQAVLAAFMNA